MNQKFDLHLEKISLEFLERIKYYEKIISICHTDADGIASSVLIKSTLEKTEKFSQIFFDLSLPWEIFIQKLDISDHSNTVLIFSDLCPPVTEIDTLITQYSKLDIIILDHHLYDHAKLIKYNERVLNANPTQFGLHGLKEIVGAALNYLFCKKIDEKAVKLAWIATLGISGDTLQHLDEMTSYNREIIEEAYDLGQIEIKSGLCLFGGQFDRIDRALSHSLLPFIPEINGSREKAKKILEQLNIEPKLKVEELLPDQINRILERFNIPSMKGEYLVFPNKKGILRYGFEHAQALSLLGHDHPGQAIQLIGTPRITQEIKSKYNKYTEKICSNLATFLKLSKIETKNAIIADLTGLIDKSEWSDTGSLASINKIFDPQKILLIGGKIDSAYKLSLRCTPQFIQEHDGLGVKRVIQLLSEKIQVKGGGHGLAGGVRLKSEKLNSLIEIIDEIIDNLR